jgi:hypothetical protein
MAMPRGRPKALSMGRAAMPSQRELDELLVDIAATTGPIKSVRGLTAVLLKKPKYKHWDESTLRRDVTVVMHWAARRLYRLPLFIDDVKPGLDETTGLLVDEAVFDKAIKAARDRPTKLNQDQFLKTLQVVRESVRSVRELLGQKQ